MMKKLLTFLILPLMFVSFFPVPVLAETNAGIGPNSIFYFFDTTFEKVGLFFTFNSEKKAQKALVYADERLAEAQESANDNKPKAVEKAMTGYKEEISFATEKSRGLKDEERAKELLNIVSESTAKHQEILASVLEKVPEEARQAILNAIEVSKKGQEEAQKQISELEKEVVRLKQELEETKEKLEHKDEEVKEGVETKENNNDKEIGKLKKEIEVLKKTPINTDAITQQKSDVPVVDKQADIPIKENFAEQSIISAKGVLVKLQAYEKALDSVIERIKERNQTIHKLLDYEKQIATKSANLEDGWSRISDTMIDTYQDDISTMADYKNKFVSGKKFATDNYPPLYYIINSYPETFIAKEKSIVDITSHNEILDGLDKINVAVNTLINHYNEYSINKTRSYKEATELIINKLQEDWGDYTPTGSNYNPPPVYIQPIVLPKTTTCYVQGYGNISSIDCYTN